MNKKMNVRNIIVYSVILFAAAFAVFNLQLNVAAQTNDEKAIADVLRQNAAAFEKNDLATLDKIWMNSESVTVFESGHANYGWLDYRNHHLAPEMKEFKNTKYAFSDIKTKVLGNLAYATMKYTISGDANGKHFDGAGLATAVLEKTNGKWKIVHWHSSAPRRQPSPTPAPKN